MTHREAIATNTALEPTDCEGELHRLTQHQDRHQGTERTVEIFTCRGCGWRVSISNGRALNHYAMPPTQVVRELAQAFEMPAD